MEEWKDGGIRWNKKGILFREQYYVKVFDMKEHIMFREL